MKDKDDYRGYEIGAVDQDLERFITE